MRTSPDDALIYLWFTLIKRRMVRFFGRLRRPATLIGFAAVAVLLGFLFYFRTAEVVGRLAQPRVLVGVAVLMVCASLFKGFLQRGLAFEPADIDFLFTSPFTQRQIVFYRLLSSYFFAVVQGLVLAALLGAHFPYPAVLAVCAILCQIACFHLATAAALFGGSIPEHLHHRLRWMMLGAFFLLTVLYLRWAWELRMVPAWFSSPLAGPLFYPGVNLPEAANAEVWHRAASWVGGDVAVTSGPLISAALCVAGFLAGALASLWMLLRFKGDLFEPSLAASERQTERRTRLEQGRQLAETPSVWGRSVSLPRLALFRGVGAIVWKNLLVARRSKRELLWVSGFGLIYTGFTIALLYLYHHLAGKAGITPPSSESRGFHMGIALFLAGLTPFLQRMLPFDFRRDGPHLLGFRTLPISSLAMAVAQVSVPTLFCLALQAPCILALLWYARFSTLTLLLVVLAYPAIGLAMNSVWNLHYLLAAVKRASGEEVTAIGTLVVVALSFLVFYPSGWTILWFGRRAADSALLTLPLGAGLLVQYTVDFLLILLLARLFHRVEVSRDAR